MGKRTMKMAREPRAKHFRGRESVPEGLHQGAAWTVSETGRPWSSAVHHEPATGCFQGHSAQGMEAAEAPASPKAILCFWAWHLSPVVVASVPAQGISTCLLKLLKPKTPTHETILGAVSHPELLLSWPPITGPLMHRDTGPAPAPSGTFHMWGELQVLNLCMKKFKTQIQVKVKVSWLKLRTVRPKGGPWRSGGWPRMSWHSPLTP